MKKVFVAIALLTASGCSGKIVVHDDAKKACDDGRCEGVKFYQLVPVTEEYYLDRVLGKDGVVTHWVGGEDGKKCSPVLMTETRMLPSQTASLITYESELFETTKFSVDLTANGTLAKVGADSTPGAKTAADTLATIATAAKTLKDANVMVIGAGDSGWGGPEAAMARGELLCSGGRVPVKTQEANRKEESETTESSSGGGKASACGGGGQPACLQSDQR